jgi:DNA repair protein RadC
VEPRQVFETAVLANAAVIIAAHNHPSRNPEPSREDLRVTRHLVEAGELMGIAVHDPIIITESGYTSLAERELPWKKGAGWLVPSHLPFQAT